MGGTNLESRSVPLQNSIEPPGSNPFSPILGPTESSIFVADSLLEPVAERLFWVYPLVSSEVFEVIEPPRHMNRSRLSIAVARAVS